MIHMNPGYTIGEVAGQCPRVCGKGKPRREVAAPRDAAALVADLTSARPDPTWEPRVTTLGPIVETAWRRLLRPLYR